MSDYDLYYWSVPFRGQFVRAVLAFAGETWAEAGSPTAVERANRVWKERLASYEEPWMDLAVREELNAFVDKRKAEGGAPTDF